MSSDSNSSRVLWAFAVDPGVERRSAFCRHGYSPRCRHLKVVVEPDGHVGVFYLVLNVNSFQRDRVVFVFACDVPDGEGELQSVHHTVIAVSFRCVTPLLAIP